MISVSLVLSFFLSFSEPLDVHISEARVPRTCRRGETRASRKKGRAAFSLSQFLFFSSLSFSSSLPFYSLSLFLSGRQAGRDLHGTISRLIYPPERRDGWEKGKRVSRGFISSALYAPRRVASWRDKETERIRAGPTFKHPSPRDIRTSGLQPACMQLTDPERASEQDTNENSNASNGAHSASTLHVIPPRRVYGLRRLVYRPLLAFSDRSTFADPCGIYGPA